MNPTRRSLFSAFASLTPAAGAVDPISEAAMNDVSRHEAERTAAEGCGRNWRRCPWGALVRDGLMPVVPKPSERALASRQHMGRQIDGEGIERLGVVAYQRPEFEFGLLRGGGHEQISKR
jgi:hypothetical protein